MKLKINVCSRVRDFIDKYKVVSLSNLLSHFYQISKSDMIEIVQILYRRRELTYYLPKKTNPAKTLYFSTAFNPTESKVIYENDVVAITKCITALETFRQKYRDSFTITYEELSFYPTVIKFGVSSKSTRMESNIQLLYLPYSENNEMAEYIGKFYDRAYDEKYSIIRYVVVEVPGMLKGKSPQQIVDNIPRTKGLVLCKQNLMSAEFYVPEELGVVIDG